MSVPPQQVKLLCADATRPAADLTLFSCTPNYSVPCITVTTVEEGRVWTAHRSNELFCFLCAVLCRMPCARGCCCFFFTMQGPTVCEWCCEYPPGPRLMPLKYFQLS